MVTGIFGLGTEALGLFLLYVGMNPECQDTDDGLCRGIAGLLLVVGPIFAHSGTLAVLAAVRRPGSIPPLVVAGAIALLPGVWFVLAVAVGAAPGWLFSFIAVVGYSPWSI